MKTLAILLTTAGLFGTSVGCQVENKSSPSTASTAATSLTTSATSDPKKNATTCGGLGTAAAPFLICDADQLSKIDSSTDTKVAGKYFKLANDIDLSGVKANAQAGMLRGFIEYFDGHLDGAGFTIKNYGKLTPAVGAFIIVNSGQISNLTFADFNVKSSFPTAAFIGLHYYGGELKNLHLKSGLIETSSDAFQPAGVLVAQSSDSSISEITIADVQLVLTNHAGYTSPSGGGAGVLSGFNERSTIENCQVSNSTISVASAVPRWIVGEVVGINSSGGVVRSVKTSVTIVNSGQ